MPEVTVQTFAEYLTNPGHLPFATIIEAIDENDFPFSNNRFFGKNPAYLAAEEYNRCVNLFLDKIPNPRQENLMVIMQQISQKEKQHEKELNELAKRAVIEMYGVPEHIKMDSEIGESESSGLDIPLRKFKDRQPIKPESMARLNDEVEKRRILNGIVHGGAIHQWTSAFYTVYTELNAIDPELIPLYDKYAALINYMNWNVPIAVMPEQHFNMMAENNQVMLQGKNKVTIDEETSKEEPKSNDENSNEETPPSDKEYSVNIDAIGNNFPVLIHELSKGVLDYLISIGIPQDLEEDELKYIFSKADKYQHEYWHYYMGPTLWRALLKTSNVNSNELPPIINYMAKLDYYELSSLCNKIVFDGNDTGKSAMDEIKKTLKIK